MKYLLVTVVVLLGVWLWRSRRDATPSGSRRPARPALPQQMVQCRHCSVHLPLAEARQGQLGLYCSEDHQRRSEP